MIQGSTCICNMVLLLNCMLSPTIILQSTRCMTGGATVGIAHQIPLHLLFNTYRGLRNRYKGQVELYRLPVSLRNVGEGRGGDGRCRPVGAAALVNSPSCFRAIREPVRQENICIPQHFLMYMDFSPGHHLGCSTHALASL